VLRLGGNQLEGTLDGFSAALEADNSLADFNVSDNKLTGPVPDALKVRRSFTEKTYQDLHKNGPGKS
jgi:hypothetical protein